MARVKLSEEQKKAQAIEDNIKREAENFQRDVNEKLKAVEDGRISPNPTRFHKVGDKVGFGGFTDSWIKEILADGLVYVLKVMEHSREKGTFEGQRIAAWHDVYRIRTKEECEQIPKLSSKFDLGNIYNQPIDSVMHRHYYWGVDMNPSYQRGNVWDMEDKLSLLDSIFNDIEIGRIVLMKRDHSDSRKEYFEIIDGKQRLTTLIEFYEDRFPYKGMLFSQMHPSDKHHFLNKQLALIETPNMTEEQVLEYFIRVNTAGRPVHADHLEKVKSMIKK